MKALARVFAAGAAAAIVIWACNTPSTRSTVMDSLTTRAGNLMFPKLYAQTGTNILTDMNGVWRCDTIPLGQGGITNALNQSRAVPGSVSMVQVGNSTIVCYVVQQNNGPLPVPT